MLCNKSTVICLKVGLIRQEFWGTILNDRLKVSFDFRWPFEWPSLGPYSSLAKSSQAYEGAYGTGQWDQPMGQANGAGEWDRRLLRQQWWQRCDIAAAEYQWSGNWPTFQEEITLFPSPTANIQTKSGSFYLWGCISHCLRFTLALPYNKNEQHTTA